MSFVTRAPVRTPFALWLRGSRPTQADGPGRSIGPEDGDYGIGMPGYTVPDPTPRSTRTDPGPEGHVRRESREVRGGEGGGRAASLGPSAGACALSEPDRCWATLRVIHSRIASPSFDVPHSSGDI